MRLWRFVLASVFAALALSIGPASPQSPPVGSGGKVQPTKTGNYTIKSKDLKTTIPFNCPSACTVTLPQSTSSWPKGYPVTIINAGTTTVTIHATPSSVLYGMPTTSGDIPLSAQGNYAVLTADKMNNYLAYGVEGSGTGPPPAGVFVLRNGSGHIARNSGGAELRNGDTPTPPTGTYVLRNGGGHIARNSGGAELRNGSTVVASFTLRNGGGHTLRNGGGNVQRN